MTQVPKKKPIQRRTSRPSWLPTLAIVCAAALLIVLMGQFGPSTVSAASGEGLRLSEVMTSNASTLLSDGSGLADWVELENASDDAIDLGGFALMREMKPAKALVFPAGTVLEPGDYLLILCDGSGQIMQADGVHAPFRLPASGDTLRLLDARGRELDIISLPTLDRDQTLCRDVAGVWKISDYPTPGEVNRIESASAAGGTVKPVTVMPGALEISELMSKNATFFPDENGNYPDYVEIHNISSAAVNLEGWGLSDSRDKLMRWRFPSVTLPAGGSLAVHCSGEDRRTDPAHLHAGFKLNSDGEEVYLTSPDGVTVSHVKAPLLAADQAYTKLETGWSRTFAPTPGQANDYFGVDAAAESMRQSNGTGVIISEVLATSARSDDWIELYNGSAEAVDLSAYGLSDNAGRPRKWQFPQGTVIQPGQYLGVVCNGSDTVSGGRVYSSFRLSAEGGYSIVLSDPSGVIFDRLFLPPQYSEISYGRMNGQGLRYFTSPSPLSLNVAPTYYGRAPFPVYSVNGGLFHTGDVLNVSLTVPGGCRVYYTTDNTDPDESDTLYTAPIQVTGTTILRTRVYCEGYLESYMDTQSYLYDVNNGDGTVYVVSLVSDPYNLTSDEAGIMVKGPNATDTFPFGSMNFGANFWMDWEREAHVEIFKGDGSALLSQECGVKLHGQYSRSEAQQAFKIIARGKYGSNTFQAPIFSKRDYTEYQSFLLRASGQDSTRTRMRDSVLSALAENTSVMYQETELCVVYLDGRYWGHYNLRERINAASICQFEGWEGQEDDIDLVKANTDTMQGSNATMEELVAWVKKNDTNNDRAYQIIDSRIDIQNYIEYMAVEIYTGNTDTLNVKRYRNALADGKWRWVLFDLDWAFNVDTNSIARWLTAGGMGNGGRTDNSLFIACMKNDRFRDQFLTHLGNEMATTFSTESIMARFVERYNALKPIIEDDMARWDRSMSAYNSALKVVVSYARERPARMLQFMKYCTDLHLDQAKFELYFGRVMEQLGVTYADIKKP